MGNDDFFSNGYTMAYLKQSEKFPSKSDKFIKRVIGGARASRQDWRNLVDIISREHVAPDEDAITVDTSATVVSGKEVRVRGEQD